MIWRLVWSRLMMTFGQRADNPQRSTTIRLATMLTAAIGTAVLLRYLQKSMQLPAGIPKLWLWAAVAVAVQISMLIMLFLARNTLGLDYQQSRLSMVWPLRRCVRWVVGLLPLLTLMVIMYIAITPPLLLIASRLHIEVLPTILALVCGGFSALGITVYQPQSLWRAVVIAVMVIGIEINLLAQITDQAIWRHPDEVLMAGFLLVLLSPIAWLGYVHRPTQGSVREGKLHFSTIEYTHMPLVWHSLKLLRHCVSRGSLITTAALSLTLAAWAMSNPSIVDASNYIWLIAVGLLSCIVVTDFRGTARRVAPPEIMTTRGAIWYWVHSISSSALLASLAISPLLLVLTALTAHPLWMLVCVVSVLGLGSSAGYLISTVLVPMRGDITAQFLAVVIGLGLVMGGHRLMTVTNIPNLAWLGLGLVTTVGCVISSLYIEQMRNPAGSLVIK